MIITCPFCGKQIKLEDHLTTEIAKEAEDKLKQELQKDFERKLEEKQKKQQEILDQQIQLAKEQAYKETEEARIISQQKSDEQHEFKQRQLEEKIRQMQLALDDANRRGAVGNNQQKGEALELKLEEDLKQKFPQDDISEIKKGKSGADVHHVVKNDALQEVGTIIYDTKNAKWQTKWIEKLQADARTAHAHIAILVSIEVPDDFEVIQMIDSHTFVVQQKYIMPFVRILRMQLQSIYNAQANGKIKDQRMAVLYKYLVGPEFRSRIESIVSGFEVLNKELDKEKRAAYTRWAHQEKAINQMISSTFSLYGDFQGLSGENMPELINSKENLYELTVEDILNADVE